MRKGFRACTVRAPLFWGPVESGVELARPLGDNDLAFFMPLLQQKREGEGENCRPGLRSHTTQTRSLSPGIMETRQQAMVYNFMTKLPA